MTLRDDYTERQIEAIRRRQGPLLLSANAGSGKTSVLVERFVATVADDGIDAGRVLAVTFTERAAGEMRARIRAAFVARERRDLVAQSETAWVSTLHGFCSRVLRQHAVAAGLDPSFTILEDGESRELRGLSFGKALASFMADPAPHALDFAAAFGADGLRAIVEETYDLLRTRGERRPALPPVAPPAPPDPAELNVAMVRAAEFLESVGDGKTVERARTAVARVIALLESGPASVVALDKALPSGGNTLALKSGPYADARDLLEVHCQRQRDVEGHAAVLLLDRLLSGYGEAYERAKEHACAVDYGDLELMTRDLLRDSQEIREAYSSRFERIMVDEFQDINPLQLDLLELLDTGNTFVVGDEFQSIYGFRHADVDVFRRTRSQRAETGDALVLPENFRSHPDLLAALNVAFVPIHGAAFTPLAGGAPPGVEWEGPRVELLLTDTDGWEQTELSADGDGPLAWRVAEARLVAGRVAELVADGRFSARDIAVLLRSGSGMGLFERALEDRGLATLASGGGGFWARRQILDLLAFLGAIANPRDEIALFSLLASPLVGMSATGLALLGSAAAPGERYSALMRAPLDGMSAHDGKVAAGFCQWFEELRHRAPVLSLGEMLEFAIVERAYDLHVLRLPGGRRRLANVLKLQRLAARFEGRHGRDVRAFIDRAKAELEAAVREPEAPIELGEADAVQLMTMHASKGLQFPVVVCADLGRQSHAGLPSLLVQGDRIGLRLSSLEEDSKPSLEFDALKAERREREAREEERVLYVASTRAQELLILSGAAKFGRWPQRTVTAPPISWLGPAFVPDLADRLAAPEPLADVGTAAGEHTSHVRVVLNTAERSAELVSGSSPQLTLQVHGGTSVQPPAPLRLEAPGVVPGLSYSALSMYGRCPYNYYLRRRLGLSEVDPGKLAPRIASDSGIDPRLRGSVVHELLEGLDLRDPRLPGADRVLQLAEDYGLELDERGVTECLALVSAFIDGPLAPRLRHAREVHREHGFTFALGDAAAAGPLVSGIVDVLAHEADGVALVVDYKTDHVTAEENLEAYVERDYDVQRRMYALAALRDGAQSVDVVHLFLLRPDEPAVARFTREDEAELAAGIQTAAAGLIAGRFPPTADPHRALCATCPGRAALCSHPPEMTGRD